MPSPEGVRGQTLLWLEGPGVENALNKRNTLLRSKLPIFLPRGSSTTCERQAHTCSPPPQGSRRGVCPQGPPQPPHGSPGRLGSGTPPPGAWARKLRRRKAAGSRCAHRARPGTERPLQDRFATTFWSWFLLARDPVSEPAGNARTGQRAEVASVTLTHRPGVLLPRT